MYRYDRYCVENSVLLKYKTLLYIEIIHAHAYSYNFYAYKEAVYWKKKTAKSKIIILKQIIQIDQAVFEF